MGLSWDSEYGKISVIADLFVSAWKYFPDGIILRVTSRDAFVGYISEQS